MAVSTVSSLTESFVSGIPVGGDDAVLSKEKEKAPQDTATSNNLAADANADAENMISENRHNLEGGQDDVDGDSELTEQSDDDGGMLEVHD